MFMLFTLPVDYLLICMVEIPGNYVYCTAFQLFLKMGNILGEKNMAGSRIFNRSEIYFVKANT